MRLSHTTRPPRSALSVLGIALALALVAVPTASARIVDEGGYFSRDAIARAESVIRQAQLRHDRNIVVETFQSPPSDLLQRFDPGDRQRFFKSWVDERAKATTADVFVLICRDPGRLQVGIGRQAGRLAFSTEDDERLNQIMAGAIKAGDADRALLEGVQFIAQRFDANAGPERAAPGTPGALPPPPQGERQGTPSPAPRSSKEPGPATPGRDAKSESPVGGVCGMGGIGGLLCMVVAGLVVFTIVRGFMRSRQARGGAAYGAPPPYGQPGPGQPGYGQPGYDPRYPQQQQGGGFGRGMGGGLLGGILGGVLGGAAYDHLRGGGNAAHGATTDPGATAGASPDADNYSSGADLGGGGGGGPDAYSSGTDLDSGGGGDFGGGGGDFSSGSDL